MHDYNNLDFPKFAEILNNTPGSLNELYEIFLEECNNLGVDSDNPVLYKGSKEDLLRVQDSEKQIDVDFQGKHFVDIINEYLLEDLSTESKVQVIKEIDNEMYQYLTLMRDSIDYKQLLSNSNEETEFESKLLSAITEVIEHGQLAKRNKKYKSKNELLFGQDENIINEQIQKIFIERKKEVSLFFENALDSKEKIKKCISTLDLMIEKYKKDNPVPDFHFKIVSIFESKKAFLEFEFEHYEELSKYLKDNSLKIASTQYSTEELEKIFLNNKYNYRPTNIDFEKQIGLERIANGRDIGMNSRQENEVDDMEWYNW